MSIYIVRQGDTLSGIASVYRTTPEELYRLNGMPNGDQLAVGQAILVPSEETLSDFSREPVYINGYVYDYLSPERLEPVMPYLSSLSIFSYGFREDGSLIPARDTGLLELTGRYQVAPVLVLTTISESGTFESDHAAVVLNDPELRSTLIHNLRAEILRKGYQGLDIDFEFVAATEKEGYLALIREATEYMNEAGITVNTDLAPKISASQPGILYESHDYRRVGATSNTVLLMTYEWGYTWGPPMAVAPLDQVERVLAYGVTEIPASRIYMGIPNYGYDWPLPYVRGTTRARSIGNEEALVIATRYRAEILYDEQSQSPYFYYTDEQETEHVVWFEDARSMVAKYELLIRYGLLGPSYWNLMRPFDQNFTVVNELFYRIRWEEAVPGLG